MRSRKNLLGGCLFVLLLFAFVFPVCAADPVSQIIVGYEELLKANPMKPGDKVQAITVSGDETATLFVARFVQGFEVKPHFHKTHSEIVYVIQGAARMTIGGKEYDLKPGSIHFNPMTKVHSLKNTSAGELVVLQIFSPEWKQPDRVFVP